MAAPRITILGAGFAGLELSSQLSETFGDAVQVTLIDANDAFVFGRTTLDAVRTHRPGRRGLLLRSQADRQLPRARPRLTRTQGAIRRQPQGALVRALAAHLPIAPCQQPGDDRGACQGDAQAQRHAPAAERLVQRSHEHGACGGQQVTDALRHA